MNEITIAKTHAAASEIKNARLADITREINAIGDSMNDNAVKIAALLGEVLADKLYEEDGFKSVADYAENLFGMNKSAAYAAARVGARFLDGGEHPAVVAALPVSKLAEIVNMTDDEITAAVESGEIDESTTQAALRAAANNHKPAAVKVEKLRTCSAVCTVPTGNGGYSVEYLTNEQFTPSNFVERVAAFIGVEVETVTVKKVNDLVSLFVCDNGAFGTLTMTKVEKTAKKKTAKFTREQLLAMLADCDE